MAGQVELEVGPDLEGDRLDRAVARLLGLSRSRAADLLEAGVTVDGEPASPSDRVRAGQTIRCAQPGDTEALSPEPVDFGIIHQDDQVLVVDKPAGLVVHPGSAHRRGTLAAGLVHRFPELAAVGPEGRAGLVHRLDKDTSGLLLVARNESAFEDLTRQMRQRRVARTYAAVVEGLVASDTGTVDAPIGADPANPTRRALTLDGKPARTHYEVIRRFEHDRVTLLEVRLETGRTHQIRVHLAAIGHPVLGDLGYGSTRHDLKAPRTCLHARRLSFSHPTTCEQVTVDSPLPADLSETLQRLS